MKKAFIPLLILIAAIMFIFGVGVRTGRAEDTGHCPALVMVKDANGQGSGVCISPQGWVITCRHCVGVRGSEAQVRLDSGVVLMGKVVSRGYTPDFDLALVKVDSPGPLPFQPVAKAAPEIGAKVWSEGWPHGQFARMEATVEKILPHIDAPQGQVLKKPQPEMVLLSHLAQPGNSGGPIFNAEGEIVGICSAVPNQTLARMIGAKPVQTFAMGPHEMNAIVASVEKALGVKISDVQGYSRTHVQHRMKLPKLYVFMGGPGCIPCVRFAADVGLSRKQAPRDPKLLAWISQRFELRAVEAEKVKHLCKRFNVNEFPTFIASNMSGAIVDYKDGPDLIQRLSAKLAETPANQTTDLDCGADLGAMMEVQGIEEVYAQIEPIPQAPATQWKPVPAGTTPVAPASPAVIPTGPTVQGDVPVPGVRTEDVATDIPQDKGIDAVILVKAQHVGLFSAALPAVERLAKGRVQKKVQDILGSKASVNIVFERLDQTNYDKITEVAGIRTPLAVGLILLVPKTVEGSAKGLVAAAEKAVDSIREKALGNIPVNVVFERTHADDYDELNSIVSAIREPTQGMSWGLMGMISFVLGSFGVGHGWLLGKWFPRKVVKPA